MKKRFARGLQVLLMAMGMARVLPGCDGGGGGGISFSDIGDNDINTLVALGDSITKGGISGSGAPYPARLGAALGKTVANEGRAGEESGSGRARIGGVLSRYKPCGIIILYGANDILHFNSPESIIANLRKMIQSAKANKTVPIVGTLTPMADWHVIFQQDVDLLNTMIRQMVPQEGAYLVDFAKEFGNGAGLLLEDGLHPNDAGNGVMSAAAYDRIK